MKPIETLVYALLFVSCTSENKEEAVLTKNETEENNIAENVIELVKETYPGEFEMNYHLFSTGTFHQDELPTNFEQKEWYGLFLADNEARLDFVKLDLERVHDPIVDDNETIKTGWSVQLENSSDQVFLIENHKMLPMGVIQHIHIPQAEFYPGDQMDFEFNGKHYSLHANGHFDAAKYETTNYRLTLTSHEDQLSTLLIAHPYFSDQITSVLFIGDLNDDGAPDFIIEGSHHYNVTEPILFMSTVSGTSLVIPWSKYTTTGC
jgi:hypothetical protein